MDVSHPQPDTNARALAEQALERRLFRAIFGDPLNPAEPYALPDDQRRILRRSAIRVIRAIREHPTKQLRNTMPPEFSAATLRAIVSNARKRAVLEGRELTISDLVVRLGLTLDNEEFVESTWRRYANNGDRMTCRQLRVVVANALGQGWLGWQETNSIWQQIDQLQAMQLTLRALKERISERKAYRLHGQIELSRGEVEQEFAKQLRIIARDATRSIDTRLKADDLPDDLREFMAEGVAELRALQRI